MKGFFLGSLALVALQVLVTGDNSGNAILGAFDIAAKGVRLFVDPTIPAFRWKAAAATAGTAKPGTFVAATTPVVPNPATNPFGLPPTPLGVPSTYA